MKYIVLAIAIFLFLGAVDSQKESKPQQHSDPVIALAQTRLNNYCPGLVSYYRDLTEEPATVSDALDYQREQWQWSRYVEFGFRVADDPIFIPNSYRAAGHHCYYRIGVDGVFAVDTPKEPCLQVCLGR